MTAEHADHTGSLQDAAVGASGTPGSRPLMEPQQAFAELGRLVVGDTPLSQVLSRVAELTVVCVPGAQEVSVTLLENDKARTSAFTGRLAAALDERQYLAGFGPCLHAAQAGQTVRIDDTADHEVYSEFCRVAVRQGVRSTVSMGIPLPQKISGAVNIYRFERGGLDDEAMQLLRVFTGYAAIALANHALYASAVALSEHLTVAMHSREIIDVAKGVIIGRLNCSSDEAFTYLVKQSQETNRKLRDIAADVVRNAGQG